MQSKKNNIILTQMILGGISMFKRKLYNQLISDLKSDLFIIITGARQVGKTTILKQLFSYLKQKNTIVHYLNLEDPDILNALNEHPKNIFSLYSSQNTKKVYFLIDEIQYLENPTNFLKYLYDEYSQSVKLYVTGSSAFYLDSKFKDSLAGRKKLYTLNTLSLSEYLHFNGKDDLCKVIYGLTYDNLSLNKIPTAYKRDLDNYIDTYMNYGGYPRVVLAQSEDEKQEILFDLINSYIKKDILESGVKNEQNVRNLLKIIASQSGNLLNANNLSNLLGLSHTAIENYLYILQKSFILNLIRPFSTNIRTEIKKMPKVYFTDLGLRNALLKDFRPLELKQDKGQIYENFIFRQFLDRIPNDDINFWRQQQGAEIDFIIKKKIAFEVKYNKALISSNKYGAFKKQYPQIPLKFIYREGKSGKDEKNYWKF